MRSIGSFTIFALIWTIRSTVGDYVLNEHQKFILDRVETVLRTSIPGTMSLLNENAFPILTGNNDGITRAHVAAAEWGRGRIVAYSHTTFYINNLPDGVESDNVKLVLNSINWIRQNGGNKVGVFAEQQMENVISEHGFEMRVLTSTDMNNITLLEEFDCLVVSKLASSSLTKLRTFLWNGGGLLLGATPWTADANHLESYWGNVIVQGTGIYYLPSFYSYGSDRCDGGCFDTSIELLKNTNAFYVWQDLMLSNWNQPMRRDSLTQMMEMLFDRLRFGPNNQTLSDEVRLEAHRILSSIPTVVPTPTAPVIQDDEKEFIIAHKYWTMLVNTIGNCGDLPAHPAAISFPGTADQQQIQETVEIDGRINWHSTGLYAVPGREIKVHALNADDSIADLEVQIGIHSDNLEKLDSWSRCPYIVFRSKMKNRTATVANPFGGPILIVSSIQRNVSLKFQIDGAIRSPTYFLGKTNPIDWKNEIRHYSAPWGELVGRNLIMSSQSSLLSQLDDPRELIEFWDLVLDTMADLAVISHERESPSRFVADVQIGGGFMHSGYPIMFYLESQIHAIDTTEMKANPWILWGFLHELGHNHQQQDWNFRGTGEVTNNLFALYVLHTLFDCPTNSTNSYSDASVAKRIKTYIDNGKQFSQWQTNYDLAFDTYVQVQEAYGWSAYQKVFANYQQLTPEKRPGNDEERIDLWMVMLSRAVEENMAEFFISWGFPISDGAIALVDSLPSTTLRIPQP